MGHLGAKLAVVLVALAAQSAPKKAPPEYSRDVSKWEEVGVIPAADPGERAVFDYAANDSNHEWRVFLDGERVQAQLASEPIEHPPRRPAFALKAGEFSAPEDCKLSVACAEVDDGWLVGFNRGEFGAALYWFSADGSRHVKVSGHQVVDFFVLPDGLYAIEGLAHLSLSRGSVIRIEREKTGGPWQATTVTELPARPCAISTTSDGRMLISLHDSLVSIGRDRKVIILLQDAPWRRFWPSSSVLSPDEKRLYIGLRQFVGEFDLMTNSLRLLIPSPAFLNRLPLEQEERTRKQFGGG